MKNDGSNDYISGRLTAKDWQARKINLAANGSEANWAKAFDDFLMARLSLRYLNPIRVLQQYGELQGEGFTIVSVQCALIEFLAALKVGKSYKYCRKGERIGSHEYTSSNALFCEFLIQEKPFREFFIEVSVAREFYRNVRCALLHEARTKNGWRIWASGDVAVDSNGKIVYRDALQAAIMSYLDSYKDLLMSDKIVQEAFIRKFDHLTEV